MWQVLNDLVYVVDFCLKKLWNLSVGKFKAEWIVKPLILLATFPVDAVTHTEGCLSIFWARYLSKLFKYLVSMFNKELFPTLAPQVKNM